MLQQSLATPTWPLGFLAGRAASVLADPHAAEAASGDTEDGSSAWTAVASGVECRALVQGPEMAMAQVRLARNAVLAVHSHRGGQGGYVLNGSLLITTPTEQLSVSTGEVYMLAAGVPHQVRAVEKTLVIEVHTPGVAVAALDIADVVRGADPLDESVRQPRQTTAAFRSAATRTSRRSRVSRPSRSCQPLSQPGDAA